MINKFIFKVEVVMDWCFFNQHTNADTKTTSTTSTPKHTQYVSHLSNNKQQR